MKNLLKAALAYIFVSGTCAASTMVDATVHGDLFSHFWGIAETLHKIETRAYRTISLATVVEEGLRAMVNKIDAHSSFFSPRSYQASLELAAGQFPGLGVSFISKEPDADSLLVVDTVHGGPADAGGIKSGDSIVKVDGQRLRGLTSDEVVNKLRGSTGTSVRLTIIRDKKPLKFTLTRALIPDRSCYAYHFPAHKTTYIALKSFSEKTPKQLESFLMHAQNKKDKGIILDMRKNPGGVVESAVKIASLILPDKSAVASTKNNKKELINSYATHGAPLYTGTIPLFVLVDNFSASAAELVSGCLQHHARLKNLPIFIIGMPTYGKGSVQEIIPLHNGCAIKLTVMLYYLPSGQCVQATGVTPDILVKPKAVPTHELKWVEELYGKETSLANHITQEEAGGDPAQLSLKKPQSKIEKKPSLEEEFLKALSNDHVIHTTITMIKSWQFAHKYAPKKVATHEKALAFLKKAIVTEPFETTKL